MATAQPVNITKTFRVYPKTLHPPKILSLSNLDRQCPLLMYLVLFYKPSNCCNHPQTLSMDLVFDRLKSGLEETLSAWNTAAGRLCLNPSDGKLDLWCNNSGAILAEAVTQVKLSELGDLSQYNLFFENLVYKPAFNGNFSDMPLVAAQVTRFGCGGYSVGIGTSHSLFDGPATHDFLSAWASCSSMTGNGRLDQRRIPVHERERLLFVGKKWSKNSRVSTGRVSAIDHLYRLIQQAATDWSDMAQQQSTDQENFVLRTFHVSGASMERLKRLVLGERCQNYSHCSSFEARTKALGVKKERMVCLQFAVDIRSKLVPPLPRGFSGNAYVLASVSSVAGELEGESHEAIIEKIKEAKNSITNEYVRGYIEALDAPQPTLPPLKELTLVSDLTRMPFHQIDFIHGEAACVSPLVPPIPQVAYFMQSPNDNKGIDMRIGLLPQTLNAFSHYFLSPLE
ncbi:hypothetical protein RJ641_022124 [Dillenia turbinata]|uniref:Omega-hydroxypalmitate O-feruloyl transferase n=1 Tax=Dillenia turbinata TaxID=194707 RepID=A0AAN8UKW2_9MAGN